MVENSFFRWVSAREEAPFLELACLWFSVGFVDLVDGGKSQVAINHYYIAPTKELQPMNPTLLSKSMLSIDI